MMLPPNGFPGPHAVVRYVSSKQLDAADSVSVPWILESPLRHCRSDRQPTRTGLSGPYVPACRTDLADCFRYRTSLLPWIFRTHTVPGRRSDRFWAGVLVGRDTTTGESPYASRFPDVRGGRIGR